MARGRVKRWDDTKGYGFVVLDGAERNDKDVFVHYSRIDVQGRKSLVEGAEVELDYEDGEKGLTATRVQPLDQD